MKMNNEQKRIHSMYKNKPNWYGINKIKFIFHNEWSDPEIEYFGRIIDSYVVEDTMWERFYEDINCGYIVPTDPKDSNEIDYLFTLYMINNTDDVYDLIELAIEEDE